MATTISEDQTPDVTVCIVAFNACEAVELTVESFRKYHTKSEALISIHDNASTDGAGEYSQKHADYYVRSDMNRSHGLPMNELCLKVDTEYTLVCDTDIEFHEPVIAHLKTELAKPNVGCVSYPSSFDRSDLGECWNHGPRRSVLRIDPCCAFFRTSILKQIIEDAHPIGWEVLNDPVAELYYDTGAVLREKLKEMHRVTFEPPWLKDSVTHFGGLSCYYVVKDMSQLKDNSKIQYEQSVRVERLANVKQRLQRLRALS